MTAGKDESQQDRFKHSAESAHPMEPFRIKAVEPIRFLTREEREEAVAEAGFNVFNLRALDVAVDLLTDSGTTAMSDNQWGGLLRGDESYAGCRNFAHLESTVQDLTGYQHVLPLHQGRAGEHLLFSELLGPGDCVVANSHFDTTAANVLRRGAIPIDLPDPACADLDREHPFKGNIDLNRLEQTLQEHGDRVKLCLLTITNNSVGGQPVSVANAQAARAIANKHGVPLFLDAARFAENAWFVSQREASQEGRAIKDIARTIFDCGDGCLLSAKKDGLANIGGFIALRDGELARRLKELMVILEGFPTYGGLAGRDLEAMAIGLEEVTDPDYLAYRTGQVAWLGDRLAAAGARVVRPVGGHAVFIDAGAMYPHIPAEQFPGQTLSVAFYREGGVRTAEIGSLMFGGEHPQTGEPGKPAHELLRLAVPRRVYTASHFEHVIRTFASLYEHRSEGRGFTIEYAPRFLRHFTARLRECPMPARRTQSASGGFGAAAAAPKGAR